MLNKVFSEARAADEYRSLETYLKAAFDAKGLQARHNARTSNTERYSGKCFRRSPGAAENRALSAVRDVRSNQAAVKTLSGYVSWIEGFVAQLRAALAVDNESAEIVNRRLIFRLFTRIIQLEADAAARRSDIPKLQATRRKKA